MLLAPDLVFRIANTAALLAWVALLASPARARWTPWVWRIAGRLLPMAFSALYLAMLLVHWRGEGGFDSIEQVRALFDVPGALVAGWLHYLAFDLFVAQQSCGPGQGVGPIVHGQDAIDVGC